MRSPRFPPFVDVSETDDCIGAAAWTLSTVPVVSGASVKGWDYGMPLRLRRTIVLFPPRIRDITHLRRSAVLRIVTSWKGHAAVALGARGGCFDLALTMDTRVEHEIILDVPSSQVAERVEVFTAVTLHQSGADKPSPLAARDPGSILWRDSVTLLLEGKLPRPPILSGDFSKLRGAERSAAWYVWTGPEWLSQHPSTGMTIYINADRVSLVHSLAARVPTPFDAAIQSMFMHDIGRSLIDRALDDDDFTDDMDYPDGSSGKSLRTTLISIFGHQPLGQMRELRKRDPESFSRTLQVRHKFLAGPL